MNRRIWFVKFTKLLLVVKRRRCSGFCVNTTY